MKRDAYGFIFPASLFILCGGKKITRFLRWRTTFLIFVLFAKKLLRFQKTPSHIHSRTYLSRVDGDHRAEGTLSFAVVSANLDMKWRERRDAVVSVHVARGAGGGGGHVGPANFSESAEGNDVTKAFTILQFFRDRLRVKHKTIVILKHIQTTHVHPAAGLTPTPLIPVALKEVFDLQIAFVTQLMK